MTVHRAFSRATSRLAALLAAAPLAAFAQPAADRMGSAPTPARPATPQYQPAPARPAVPQYQPTQPPTVPAPTMPGINRPGAMAPNAAQPRPQDRARQSDRPAAGSIDNTTQRPRSTLTPRPAPRPDRY
ncbi:hypothetical protein CEK29_22245 [Bordetella genomosp. 5]|uniref:hypothetical protein n=1 Tax=Bordetella genomosp. 5 TaxID=1395608 RepID=UPI000B9EAC32|nr:hypothetical protein [Bordetella genomosp. 5]OZI33568.1 hypothetical protein CEK29_22245 [Bordetella genomosp. 5]